MDKDVLTGWLREGRSLEWIGREVGKSASTVGYWIAKHGLEAAGRDRHAPRGALDAEVLRQLVAEHLTLSEIAAQVDRSPGTVGHWLRRYGLSTTRAARTKDRRQSADSRFTTMCRRHGRTEFVIRGDGTSCCVKCRSAAVVAWRRGVKQRLIAEAGGRCTLCGYSRCAAALQFHHRDPDAKVFGIGSRGLGRSWESLVAEAAKCALLCANCHAEVEAGVATLR